MRSLGRTGADNIESFCLDCGLIQRGRLYYSSCPVCRCVYLEAAVVYCTAPCRVSWRLRLLIRQCPRAGAALAGAPSGCALAWFRVKFLGSGNDPDGRSCRAVA